MNRIQQTIQDLSLPKKVVLACSGGLDSTVLLDALCRYRNEVQLVVAHVNYRLRAESDGDAAFVRRLAERHGLTFYERVMDLSMETSAVEEQARRGRYAFFDEVLQQSGATALLLAQHQDDQLETILLQIIRGGTFQKKTGMPAQEGKYLRPFLSLTKSDLFDYATLHGLSWREDKTNQNSAYTKRNKLRLEVLPALKAMNERMPEHLLGLAEQLAKQQELITGQALRYLPDFQEDFSSVPREWWPACLTEMAKEKGLYQLKSSQINATCQLLKNAKQPNGRVDLADDYFFERTYQKIRLRKKERVATFQKKKMMKVAQQNGPLVLELDQWYFLTDSMLRMQESVPLESDEQYFCLPNDPGEEFMVTLANKDDRLAIAGGHKTVRRLLIDEKIPTEDRPKTCLLKDQKENVLAVFLGQKRWYFTADWPKKQPSDKRCLVWRIEEN